MYDAAPIVISVVVCPLKNEESVMRTDDRSSDLIGRFKSNQSRVVEFLMFSYEHSS